MLVAVHVGLKWRERRALGRPAARGVVGACRAQLARVHSRVRTCPSEEKQVGHSRGSMRTLQDGLAPPSASAMSCAEARSCISALLEGPIALTDWALAEVHLRQCMACREQEPRLRDLTASRRLAARRQVTLDSLRKAAAVSRAGVTRATILIARSRALLTTATRFPLRAIAGARTRAGAIQAIDLARLIRSPRAIPFGPSAGASAVLVLVCSLLPSDRPQQHARPAPPPRTEFETRLEPVPLVPLPPPPAEETGRSRAQTSGVAALSPPPVPLVPLLPTSPPSEETGLLRAQPARAVALSPPRARPSEAALPAVPDDGPTVSTIHVVGRLSARERSAAERQFSALLAGVGGIELGRRHRVGSTALDVVVPHARYDEFAHGLARIGSWQLEAERIPLPDTVHITIHVSGQPDDREQPDAQARRRPRR